MARDRTAYQRKYYLANRVAQIAKSRAYRLANPERMAFLDRRSQLSRQYGLTLFCHYAMLVEQDFRCAICRTDDPGKGTWHTDHDHGTGQVRGLLCNHCNLGLGHFKDSPESLATAIEYVKHHAALHALSANTARATAISTRQPGNVSRRAQYAQPPDGVG